MKNFYKLMLVTHRQSKTIDEYLEFVQRCVIYGVTSIQLREKNTDWNSCLEFGRKLKVLLRPSGIPLIVNDSIKLALALDAEGVHLGQSDGDPALARKALGEHKIIGVSVDSEKNVMHANDLAVNYVCVSPVFKTTSKIDVADVCGIKGLKLLAQKSKHIVMAIGGINELSVQDVIDAGAQGVAVINALHNSSNLENTIKNLIHIINKRESNVRQTKTLNRASA